MMMSLRHQDRILEERAGDFLLLSLIMNPNSLLCFFILIIIITITTLLYDSILRQSSRKMFNRSLSISYVDNKLKSLEIGRKRESKTLELLVSVAQRPAMLVQSVLRMFMARAKYKKLLFNLGKPSPVLYRTMRRSQEALERHSATLIQALFKGVYARVLLFQEGPIRSAFYRLQRSSRSQREVHQSYHGERIRRKVRAGLQNVFRDTGDRDSQLPKRKSVTAIRTNVVPDNLVAPRATPTDTSLQLLPSGVGPSAVLFCDIKFKRTPIWCTKGAKFLLSPKASTNYSTFMKAPAAGAGPSMKLKTAESLLPVKEDEDSSFYIRNAVNKGVKDRIPPRYICHYESDTDSEDVEDDMAADTGAKEGGEQIEEILDLVAQRQQYLRPRLVRHLADQYQSDDE